MGGEIERVDGPEQTWQVGRPSHFGSRQTGPLTEPGTGPERPTLSVAQRAAAVVACVIVAVVSMAFVAPFASSPQTHASTIQSLDKKAETVTGLVALSTATSTAITLVPGDVGTPIAEELANLSSDFLVVLAAIYLEKYLLTIFGRTAFIVLVPAACALLACSFTFYDSSWKPSLRRLSAKLALFAVAILLAVPVSVGISNMIEATYAEDAEQAAAFAAQVAEEAREEADATAADTGDAAQDAASDASAQADSGQTPLESFTSWLTGVGSGAADTVGDVVSGVTTGATEIVDKARNVLNGMVEALAVMIVTSCVIPILVLVFFIWLANTILGLDVSLPTVAAERRGLLAGRVAGRK